MELCTGGDLQEVAMQATEWTEDVVKEVLRQCLSAVIYLHAKGIVHRDLKLENFLLSQPGGPSKENKVKLCDFGTSHRLAAHEASKQKMWQFAGTPTYVAPEVWTAALDRNQSTWYNITYDEKCDIWSIGVMAFKLLTGEFPFSVHASDTAKQVLSAKPMQTKLREKINGEIPFPGHISKGAKNFIQLALIKAPH